MNDDIPTIEAEEGWPFWADEYAVDYDGSRCVYEGPAVMHDDMPLWVNKCGHQNNPRVRKVGEATEKPYPFWFRSKRRIVRTPKKAQAEPDAVARVTAAAQALAVKLTICGYAVDAYNTLKQHGIPVPALVEREATGVDGLETERKQ